MKFLVGLMDSLEKTFAPGMESGNYYMKLFKSKTVHKSSPVFWTNICTILYTYIVDILIKFNFIKLSEIRGKHIPIALFIVPQSVIE